jgi:DNA-binding winged helix-turn-helix (wHTH) protein
VLYRFGAFELDEAKGELRREGSAVAIQPKPLALLALLLRERERFVPADEILATLWPDTAVTPGSLNRAVSHARRAIGDTHQGRVIKSVARRGYRFAGEVRVQERGAAMPARAAPPGHPFVGREDAQGTLRVAWANALASRRSGFALISGPPGIGKTRLAEMASAEIEAAGGLVLAGRAREGEGVPAFWLWAQVLRRLQEAEGSAEALREVVRHGSELSELLGLDAPAPSTPRSPEQSRFLLLDGIARVLERAARQRPLLVWLDDLQWAGAESLRVMEHLAHEDLAAPLLVLATVRDEPREAGDPVARSLALLRAQDRCAEVTLGPLSRAQVAALAERVLGRPAPADLT